MLGVLINPHQKSLSLWQMETITEHPSWTQCRNQWIVGSPTPNGYIYITSARATDSNKTPTPGMKLPLSCWSGVFKGFSKHYKLLLLSLVAPRGGRSAPFLGDSHTPQIQDPEDLSRIRPEAFCLRTSSHGMGRQNASLQRRVKTNSRTQV